MSIIAPTLVIPDAASAFCKHLESDDGEVIAQEGEVPLGLCLIPMVLAFNLGTLATYRYLRLVKPSCTFAVRISRPSPDKEEVRVSFMVVRHETGEFRKELSANARAVITRYDPDKVVFFLIDGFTPGETPVAAIEWIGLTQAVSATSQIDKSSAGPFPGSTYKEIISVKVDRIVQKLCKEKAKLSPDACLLVQHVLGSGRFD